MSMLYACIHAAEFPAQVLLRLRPDLASHPVAVLDGRRPEEFVGSMNLQALRRGVALGMTRLDVEGLQGVRVLRRSLETELAARVVLMECVARFSPRIEEISVGTACGFVLDITGTERLFGPPAQLAKRLRAALAEAGFRASIVVSANYHTARMKASAWRGILVIPEGEEAAALAKLPISAGVLEEAHRETFAMWGIRTLGELAALPEEDLVTRMGHEAREWREAARGTLSHLFQPIEPEFTLQEFCAFETPVEQMESLLFMGARMIDCLVARATDRALSLALLTVTMKLDGGGIHQRELRPAIASSDRKFLLKLLQLEIAAHPPQSAVLSIELRAEAAHSNLVQLGLFAPQTPEPSRLDVTLARLKSIVGEDRVGSPALEDSHRPRSFRMESFAVQANYRDQTMAGMRMALRCMRPPIPLRVNLSAQQPVSFSDGAARYRITSAYGPWRSSGCWWAMGEWNREEWDVMATGEDGLSAAYLLVCEGNEWRLEASYD